MIAKLPADAFDSGSAPGGAEGWATAARAERRLQAAQMAILALLALIVLSVAVLTGRAVGDTLADYRAELALQSRTDALRFTLQEQETAFSAFRASGGTGMPPGVAATVLSVAGEIRSLREEELALNATPGLVRAVDETTANLDALIALVLANGSPAPVGSPADRRFVARVSRLAGELKASGNAWSAAKDDDIQASSAALRSATRRIVTFTGAAAVVAMLLGLLTWALVARSRRRIVAELRHVTERLRHQADTDPLTGLVNQRRLHAWLQSAAADARRDGTPLSAIMMDLDHFKAVNDTFGHPVGDLVLVETARRLEAATRPGDLVARIGGEEFLVLTPATDGANALAVAERIRDAMGSADFPGEVGRLSASLGVATLREDLDADGLLEEADAALYWAKTHGRDAAFRFSTQLMTDLSPNNRARQIARADGLSALRALALAIDAKDPATQRHSVRVADLAVRIAGALGWTPEQAARLREAGLVHDVGKIGVPDAILLKPSGLTVAEIEVMQGHAALGAVIVSEVLDTDQAEWVAHHHERWDGGGYPAGLGGPAIPEGARILAIADSWDAMTSSRDYRSTLSADEALEECRRCSGSQFWRAGVEALDRLAEAGALPARRTPVAAGAAE